MIQFYSFLKMPTQSHSNQSQVDISGESILLEFSQLSQHVYNSPQTVCNNKLLQLVVITIAQLLKFFQRVWPTRRCAGPGAMFYQSPDSNPILKFNYANAPTCKSISLNWTSNVQFICIMRTVRYDFTVKRSRGSLDTFQRRVQQWARVVDRESNGPSSSVVLNPPFTADSSQERTI